MDLTATVENVDPFLDSREDVTVKVGRALLEFGEIFHALQRALRTKQALNVHAAQRWRIDAMTELLRPDVPYQVRRGIGVAVRMTIEADHAAARPLRAPV